MEQTIPFRNWILWLLAGLLALVLTGCGGASGGTTGGAPPKSSTEPDPIRSPAPSRANLELISITPNGKTGNNRSSASVIFQPGHMQSADGRYVTFWSEATNLVEGDTNGEIDIFVRDRLTGETTRVSVDSAGNQSDEGVPMILPFTNFAPTISADGRFVAFMSAATNLVPGDTNDIADVFVHDRLTGETTRVSVDSDGNQAIGTLCWPFCNGFPSISADGRFVAFQSSAINLVPGVTDEDRRADIYVHDRLTGETTRVSVNSDGDETTGDDKTSSMPSISADGRFVAFWSRATNLVPGDTNGLVDTFVHDRLTGETTRVSVDSDGNQTTANFSDNRKPFKGDSFGHELSADGRFVVFGSWATNLVTGDTNGAKDVFVHDRLTGETTRVSVNSDGNQANAESGDVSISADGRFVAFASMANNLVAGDSNDNCDSFVHDRLTGETTRVSVTPDETEGNNYSYKPIISPDGCMVMFTSEATNLVAGDTNGETDVFTTTNALLSCDPPKEGDPPGDDDDDGLTNQQELTETFTHYFKADSDEDGVDDGTEVANGTDPLDPADF